MADYVTTEPAFDFERGDFVIINGRPKMVVGMDRLRSWIGKVLRTQKGRYKIYNGTSSGRGAGTIRYNRRYIHI